MEINNKNKPIPNLRLADLADLSPDNSWVAASFSSSRMASYRGKSCWLTAEKTCGLVKRRASTKVLAGTFSIIKSTRR